MNLIITALALFFAINFAAIAKGFGILAIMLTGPVLFGLFLYFLHKSKDTDFNFAKKKLRLISVGVGSFMFVSIGTMVLFIMKNPDLIW